MRLLIAIAAVTALGQAQPAAASPRLDEAVSALVLAWDQARFQSGEDEQQLAALRRVEAQATALVQQFPGEAKPILWQAATLAAEADESGIGSALTLARRAKALLEGALSLDADPATKGGLYTLLGVLYYQAPGFPIAFGNDRTAETHLRQGLALNPRSIEANFYMGDFLFEQGRYSEAAAALHAAINAPSRPGRDIADAAFRQDARRLLARAERHLVH